MTSEEKGLSSSGDLLADAMRQVFTEATERAAVPPSTEQGDQLRKDVSDDIQEALKGE
jgi:hypothetical protein